MARSGDTIQSSEESHENHCLPHCPSRTGPGKASDLRVVHGKGVETSTVSSHPANQARLLAFSFKGANSLPFPLQEVLSRVAPISPHSAPPVAAFWRQATSSSGTASGRAMRVHRPREALCMARAALSGGLEG
jgi:hypothetical protein